MLSNEIRMLEKENEELRDIIKSLKQETMKSESKPMACEHCKFYIQHYGKFQDEFRVLHAGHCTRGRVKSRKPDASCEYFELGIRP